jgi:hypothetical protein
MILFGAGGRHLLYVKLSDHNFDTGVSKNTLYALANDGKLQWCTGHQSLSKPLPATSKSPADIAIDTDRGMIGVNAEGRPVWAKLLNGTYQYSLYPYRFAARNSRFYLQLIHESQEDRSHPRNRHIYAYNNFGDEVWMYATSPEVPFQSAEYFNEATELSDNSVFLCKHCNWSENDCGERDCFAILDRSGKLIARQGDDRIGAAMSFQQSGAGPGDFFFSETTFPFTLPANYLCYSSHGRKVLAIPSLTWSGYAIYADKDRYILIAQQYLRKKKRFLYDTLAPYPVQWKRKAAPNMLLVVFDHRGAVRQQRRIDLLEASDEWSFGVDGELIFIDVGCHWSTGDEADYPKSAIVAYRP